MNDPLDRLLRECCVQVKGAEQGTGFFVAPDLVLTCAHVVGRDRKPGDRRTRVTLANGAQKDDAKIRSIFPQEDLALLEVEPGPSHCVILGEQVCANERLLLMGFPVYDQAVGPECDGLNVWEDSETVDANGNTLVKFRGNLV